MSNIAEIKTRLEKAQSERVRLNNEIEAIQQELKNAEKEEQENIVFKRQKEGEDFYVVRADDTAKNIVMPCMEIDSVYCNDCFRNNNYFLSRSTAQEAADKIGYILLLIKLREELCPNYKPDFRKPNENKYYVTFDHIERRFIVIVDKWAQEDVIRIYFSSRETAQKAANIVNAKKEKQELSVLLP